MFGTQDLYYSEPEPWCRHVGVAILEHDNTIRPSCMPAMICQAPVPS